MCSLRQHIYWNWNDTEKISMAPAQGWYANSWSVPYLKKKKSKQEDCKWTLGKLLCCQLNLALPRSGLGLPLWLSGKESTCQEGDLSLIPGSGRSPGEGNGNPLQYSCLENPMERGSWQAVVHEVTRVIHNLATKQPQQIRFSRSGIFCYNWSRIS